jgi:uncharacterized protein YkwD
VSRRSIAALLLIMAAACAAHAAPRKVAIPRTLARDIGREIDLLRKNPKAYARHLEALRPRYDGKLLRLDGRDPIRTKEGKKPLDQAIKRLKKTKALGTLAWESGLARAAADHAADIGARGVVDHFGPKGESPTDRVARYGILQGLGGENIAVAFSDARMVVLYLLIDDGVADRGHREALLDRRYEQVGVACAAHRTYRVVCVMDFAAGYASLVK